MQHLHFWKCFPSDTAMKLSLRSSSLVHIKTWIYTLQFDQIYFVAPRLFLVECTQHFNSNPVPQSNDQPVDSVFFMC